MNDNTPVLVGCAQSTKHLPPKYAMTPLQMMSEVSQRAAEDAGLSARLLSQVDTIATTRIIIDSTDLGAFAKEMFGVYTNMPKSLGQSFSANPAHCFYAAAGGNTPQMLVNKMAQRIAAGESDFTLIAGSENVATMMAAIKSGSKLRWSDDTGDRYTDIGDSREGVSEYEMRYNLYFPINTYPMFENAIRANRGTNIEAHQKFLGEFMSPFTKVAANNKHAWFPTYRSPEEISVASESNRMVGFPYTKYLNSVINVDMASALVMMSVGTAKKMGIDPSRWVFLNGCADANEKWFLSDRVDFHSSPAIQRAGKETLEMARTKIDDIDYFDLYSCFPAVVQIACEALGIPLDDKRDFTVTGGLPYFGGPGNNYVLHSIAEMMDRVRAKPGSQGLVTANGWHITKHSMGIYSTEPKHDKWKASAPDAYQKDIDAMESPAFTETPEGSVNIETYTVTHDKNGPVSGIVFGRDENGARCLAETEKDKDLLEDMKVNDYIGVSGSLRQQKGQNIFKPQ